MKKPVSLIYRKKRRHLTEGTPHLHRIKKVNPLNTYQLSLLSFEDLPAEGVTQARKHLFTNYTHIRCFFPHNMFSRVKQM